MRSRAVAHTAYLYYIAGRAFYLMLRREDESPVNCAYTSIWVIKFHSFQLACDGYSSNPYNILQRVEVNEDFTRDFHTNKNRDDSNAKDVATNHHGHDLEPRTKCSSLTHNLAPGGYRLSSIGKAKHVARMACITMLNAFIPK